MKVALTNRVSSSHQAKQGDSIEAQEQRLINHSKENNDEIVGIYTDAGKSASIFDDKFDIEFSNGKFIIKIDLNKRPALKKLIEEAPLKKFEGIKFTKWDRLSRNNILSKILQIYFAKYNIKLVPTDDSNEPLLVDIKGVLGEEEVKKMKERVRSVRINRFDKGIFVGRSHFGYAPLIKDKKIIGFKIYEKEANIVRNIFDSVIKGIDYRIICKENNLKPQQYYNIIKNPVYAGYITFEGNIKKGIHEAIIDINTFRKVNPNFKP
jgi:site-specific DNA recombinase